MKIQAQYFQTLLFCNFFSFPTISRSCKLQLPNKSFFTTDSSGVISKKNLKLHSIPMQDFQMRGGYMLCKDEILAPEIFLCNGEKQRHYVIQTLCNRVNMCRSNYPGFLFIFIWSTTLLYFRSHTAFKNAARFSANI